MEFYSAVECFHFVPLLGWNFENESGNGHDTVYLYFINWNGIVLATFQARPFPKKNSFNPQFRWTFFLKHFQLEQTNPHSFRLQFKRFCLPHVLVWNLAIEHYSAGSHRVLRVSAQTNTENISRLYNQKYSFWTYSLYCLG